MSLSLLFVFGRGYIYEIIISISVCCCGGDKSSGVVVILQVVCKQYVEKILVVDDGQHIALSEHIQFAHYSDRIIVTNTTRNA